MNKILTKNEITKFKEDGAIFLKNKFDISWINKLKIGIEKDIANPSPRFKSHTTIKNVPAYLEDYWTWHLIPEFKEFVYKSPYAQIAAELMSAKKINLVMDNWFLREAGSKSELIVSGRGGRGIGLSSRRRNCSSADRTLRAIATSMRPALNE